MLAVDFFSKTVLIIQIVFLSLPPRPKTSIIRLLQPHHWLGYHHALRLVRLRSTPWRIREHPSPLCHTQTPFCLPRRKKDRERESESARCNSDESVNARSHITKLLLRTHTHTYINTIAPWS